MTEKPESGGQETPDAQTSALEAALRATLDRHGYGFQYALLKHIDAIRPPWSVEAAEVPVTLRGKTTHVDFVLRHQRSTFPLRIVAECKRANPALVDWCFLRLPHTPLAGEVRFEQVRVQFPAVPSADGSEQTTAFVGLTDSHRGWSSQRVYNLGLPIKGNTPGDRSGDNRTALDEAVTQVLRGTNGFIEKLAREPQLLVRRGNNAFGFVLPAVFTTARLWVTEVDIAESDLATGATPPVPLRPERWLWLKQNISPDLKHTLLPDDIGEPLRSFRSGLEDLIVRDYSRLIAIVGGDGVSDFLKMDHWSFWG